MKITAKKRANIFAHIKDDVLFSSLFPTIKLSHPEAERKFQKIVFEVFSFLHLYRLGRKDGETEVK